MEAVARAAAQSDTKPVVSSTTPKESNKDQVDSTVATTPKPVTAAQVVAGTVEKQQAPVKTIASVVAGAVGQPSQPPTGPVKPATLAEVVANKVAPSNVQNSSPTAVPSPSAAPSVAKVEPAPVVTAVDTSKQTQPAKPFSMAALVAGTVKPQGRPVAPVQNDTVVKAPASEAPPKKSQPSVADIVKGNREGKRPAILRYRICVCACLDSLKSSNFK